MATPAPKRRKPNRAAELSDRQDVSKALVEVFEAVEQGFNDQNERADNNLDNWDLYDCKLTDKQFYHGTTRVFLPIIADAVEARKTRFTNQLFPVSGRFVEVTTNETDLPQATMSLLENYVSKCKIQTEIVPALCVNGDLEGQYSIYVSGETLTKNLTRRVSVPDDEEVDPQGLLGVHDEYRDERQKIWKPHVEVLNDNDLLILPVTADSVEQAIEVGGSATVMRRWTKGAVKKKIANGDIDREAGEALIARMGEVANGRDAKAARAAAAGIIKKGKEVQVYETWTRLKLAGEMVLCVAYFADGGAVLSCKQCPYWCDSVPVLSVPVKKIAGSVKGKAPVDKVADVQILANDFINEGADTAHFSAMPIVMTNPEKNPRTSSMVLGLAAIWETSPQDTAFAEFPDLWTGALQRAQTCQAQVFQSLGVNPSMVPQGGSSGGEMSQAEIANQQQVDLLTTADAITVIEQGILTPMLQRFAEYDHQFRDEDTTIEVFGEMGVRAKMERVEPIQLDERWAFRWFGAEAARTAAQIQQQIAAANVIKGIPPQMYDGYELDMTPAIIQLVESAFGPRIGPLVFKKKPQVSMDPMTENDMLQMGFAVPVNQMDDDQQHLEAHMGLLDAHPDDPHGVIRPHIMAHMQQMAAKTQSPQGAPAPAGAEGMPGSPGGAGPGVAGTPAPRGPAEGGQVEGPRQMKQPPGAVHPDEMSKAGAVVMPRNT